MTSNDYIIAVDEDGQPYIAHALSDHKYIQKIIRNGKAVYFYTRKQLENYLQKRRVRQLMKQQQAGSNANWQNNRPSSHQKTITGSAKEGWSTRRTYNH